MPIVDGKTLVGWGAVREAPWHFAGLFRTQQEAQLKADEMGDGYVARYGERRESPDTFAFQELAIGAKIAGSIVQPFPTGRDQHGRLKAVARWIDGRIARLRSGVSRR